MKSTRQLLREFIALILSEEFIGNKGGVNYYQMGGSIERPDLYNLDSRGRATKDPGMPGLKKTRRKKRKTR